MKTLTIDVRSPRAVGAECAAALRTGRRASGARLSFTTPELLWKTLTAKRWQLIRTLCGAGPMSIREAARRVGRDVKGVHGDVTALIAAGLLERVQGGVEFPFDAVKVEFVLQPA